MAGECIAEMIHGKRWRRTLGPDGTVGALLVARGLMQLDAWIMAHADAGKRRARGGR